MGKYIDAEKLKTELNKRIELLENGDAHPEVMKRVEGVIQGYKVTLSIIDSLQQEQNFAQDTELTYFESALFTAFSYAWQDYLRGEEVNVAQWAKENSAELLEAAKFQQEQPEVDLERDAVQFCFDKGFNITPYQAKTIARHFYELGKNSK